MSDIKQWLTYKNWAVVGASNNKQRYGYKIMKRLLLHNYNVFPVSRNYEEVQGAKAYGLLTDIEDTIDVVDMVVNPSIGIHIIDDCAKKGVKCVILQPGASSPEIKKKAESLGIEAVDACVLVLLSWNKEN